MKKLSTMTVVAAFLLLGGCLSGEESTPLNESSETPTGSQNRAPKISGAPDSAVIAGDAYDFTPSATDADGDPISFAVVNKPSWATFDERTGQLSGQLTLGDIGIYDAITISVSDGTHSVDLQSFSIEVTQAALGSMTLNWSAPTENSDGTVLTNLAGFNIYYGTSPGNYTHQVRIDNPSINTYLVENLLPKTYYVVATAFNNSGIESTYSNVATKTVESI